MTQFLQPGKGIEDPLDISAKTAEIKIAAYGAEHKIAYRGLDHLSDLLKSCFPDSKIAERMTIKRTKGTAIVRNAVGEVEKC